MKTPWFLHHHSGMNTMVAIYPTPFGTYVRSNGPDCSEVQFYPLDETFVPHQTRSLGPCFRFCAPIKEELVDKTIASHFKGVSEAFDKMISKKKSSLIIPATVRH